MIELIVATRNKGKMREIRELLAGLDLSVTSLLDYPDMPEIEEDGKTFDENAIKKAMVISKHTGKLTMGEDSGLEVEPLGWAPGIYSARFSGPGATDEKNNEKLRASLKDIPLEKRRARYHCSIALVDQGQVVGVVEGQCEGLISLEYRGTNGFGYDPLFIVPQYNKTFGELDPAIKAKISHRAKALEKFKVVMAGYIKSEKRN